MKLVCEECKREKNKLHIVWAEGKRKVICSECLRVLKRTIRKMKMVN